VLILKQLIAMIIDSL